MTSQTHPLVVALVGCGKRKASVQKGLPAKDLYTGVLFRLAFGHALKTADDVLILSALHGLICPYRVTEPYDFAMSQRTSEGREAWGNEVVSCLNAEYPMTRLHLVFYAGMQYVKPVMRALPEKKPYWTWENPLDHMDMFQRIRWLKQQQDQHQE